MVTPLARAGVAVGADGLIIEVHDRPERALSDGAQALTPPQYEQLVKRSTSDSRSADSSDGTLDSALGAVTFISFSPGKNLAKVPQKH